MGIRPQPDIFLDDRIDDNGSGKEDAMVADPRILNIAMGVEDDIAADFTPALDHHPCGNNRTLANGNVGFQVKVAEILQGDSIGAKPTDLQTHNLFFHAPRLQIGMENPVRAFDFDLLGCSPIRQDRKNSWFEIVPVSFEKRPGDGVKRGRRRCKNQFPGLILVFQKITKFPRRRRRRSRKTGNRRTRGENRRKRPGAAIGRKRMSPKTLCCQNGISRPRNSRGRGAATAG